MRRCIPLISLLFVFAVLPALAAAQPLGASPAASPVAGGWHVTDTRDIAVEGKPLVLSPDGKWLAGMADDGNSVCAWDVATLTPTCADVPEPVEPYLGYGAMRWSPDSSAFAFVSGSVRRLIPGNVQVFDLASGELMSLTTLGNADHSQIFIGADWTDDGSQVVFGVINGFDADSPPDDVFRVDRNGGEPVSVPLPEWSEPYDILFPPIVANGAVTFAVMSDSDIAGVWRVGLDGTNPRQLVTADQVSRPFVASMSPSGRYVNVVSIVGLRLARMEGTFFLLDAETGELLPLVSEDGLNLMAFGPDGVTGLMVRDGRLKTIDLATGVVTPVANSPEVNTWLSTIPVWVENDTVFLPGDGGGTIVTLAPVG